MLVNVRAPTAVRSAVSKYARRLGGQLVSSVGRSLTRIYDGFIVKASKVGRITTVDVIDPPALMVYHGGLNTGVGVWKVGNPRVSLALGRSTFIATADGGAPSGYPIANNPIGTIATDVRGVNLGGSTSPSALGPGRLFYSNGDYKDRFVVSAEVVAPALTDLSTINYAQFAVLFYVNDASRVYRPAEITATPTRYTVGAAVGPPTSYVAAIQDAALEVSGGHLVTHVSVAGLSATPRALVESLWQSQANANVAIFAAYFDAEQERYILPFSMQLKVEASVHDGRGRCATTIGQLEVVASTDGLDVTASVFYVDDTTTLTNPLSQPLLEEEPSASYPEIQPVYNLNACGVTYVAPLAEGRMCAVVRHWVLQQQEGSFADRYGTVRVLRYTPAVGGLAPSWTTIVDPAQVAAPDITPNMDLTDRWFLRGLGMDSDGETAVFVGCCDWRVSDLVGGFLPWQSDFGVICISNTGVTTQHFADPGWWAPWQKPVGDEGHVVDDTGQLSTAYYNKTGLVTYIGNDKFVFPVVVGTRNPSATQHGSSPAPYVGDVDFCLAVYDLAAGSMELLATIFAGPYGSFPFFRGVSRVFAVQHEIADDDGDVTQPAILLVDYGHSEKALQLDENTGHTYVSYDSGVTWAEVVAKGSGWGVYYVGNVLKTQPAGQLWVQPPEEEEP